MAVNNAINSNQALDPNSTPTFQSIITPAYNNISVSSVTTLNNTAFGKRIVCTGSSYALNLPVVTSNNNKWLKIQNQGTNNIITVTPQSGSINGQSSISLGSGDSIIVTTNGTNWFIDSLFLQPCEFSAYLSTNQAIASGGNTRAAIDTAEYNIGGYFNTSTHFFQPFIPGLYVVIAKSSIDMAGSTGFTELLLAKNNSIFRTDTGSVDTGSNFEDNIIVTDMFFNGSGDNIDMQVFQNSGSPQNLAGSEAATYFSARRVSLF